MYLSDNDLDTPRAHLLQLFTRSTNCSLKANKALSECETGKSVSTWVMVVAVAIPVTFLLAVIGVAWWKSGQRNKMEEKNYTDFDNDEAIVPAYNPEKRRLNQLQQLNATGPSNDTLDVKDFDDPYYSSPYFLPPSVAASRSSLDSYSRSLVPDKAEIMSQYSHQNNYPFGSPVITPLGTPTASSFRDRLSNISQLPPAATRSNSNLGDASIIPPPLSARSESFSSSGSNVPVPKPALTKTSILSSSNNSFESPFENEVTSPLSINPKKSNNNVQRKSNLDKVSKAESDSDDDDDDDDIDITRARAYSPPPQHRLNPHENSASESESEDENEYRKSVFQVKSHPQLSPYQQAASQNDGGVRFTDNVIQKDINDEDVNRMRSVYKVYLGRDFSTIKKPNGYTRGGENEHEQDIGEANEEEEEQQQQQYQQYQQQQHHDQQPQHYDQQHHDQQQQQHHDQQQQNYDQQHQQQAPVEEEFLQPAMNLPPTTALSSPSMIQQQDATFMDFSSREKHPHSNLVSTPTGQPSFNPMDQLESVPGAGTGLGIRTSKSPHINNHPVKGNAAMDNMANFVSAPTGSKKPGKGKSNKNLRNQLMNDF